MSTSSTLTSEYTYETTSPSLNIFSGDNWVKVGKMFAISAAVGIIASVIIVILIFVIGIFVVTSSVNQAAQGGMNATDALNNASSNAKTGSNLMMLVGLVVGVMASMFTLTSFEYWEGCEFKHKKA